MVPLRDHRLLIRFIASTLVVATVAVACARGGTPASVEDDLTTTGTDSSTSGPDIAVSSTPSTRRTPSPGATMTAIPNPTATPEPTASPEPTATPNPTATPEPTPTPEPLAAAEAMSRLERVDCPIDVANEAVVCHRAYLPLDATNPDPTQMVSLMVAEVDNGDPGQSGPIVFLQGGPGIGSVTSAPSFVGAGHDVVFVDQRGAGYSTPKLACPEVDELWQTQHTADPATRLVDAAAAIADAYRRCSIRLLTEGVDFDHFNTTAAATDIELLRRLMGHQSWSIWGISYGTRLGLTVARDHPDGVRAAVLDSILPFEVDFFATLSENAYRSMAALDAACDATSCSSDHGDFLDNLAELTARLDRQPRTVQVTRPESGETFGYLVGGTQLIEMVFAQLYSTRRLGSLPRQIGRADFGGLEEIVAGYVQRRDPERLDLAAGLYYTTWCREEFPFHDPDAGKGYLEDLPSALGLALEQSLNTEGTGRLCSWFSVTPAEAVEDQMLVSDVPTLVMAGSLDPITPPAWSRQVADAFTAATYVEFADHGHGMSSACARSLRVQFLADPTGSLDLSCAQAGEGPEFD